MSMRYFPKKAYNWVQKWKKYKLGTLLEIGMQVSIWAAKEKPFHSGKVQEYLFKIAILLQLVFLPH